MEGRDGRALSSHEGRAGADAQFKFGARAYSVHADPGASASTVCIDFGKDDLYLSLGDAARTWYFSSVLKDAAFDAPQVPSNELARLELLEALEILDTAPEPALDHVVRWASRVIDVPIALLSLVDRDRQWFKARCGLDATETPRTISFCGHAILATQPLIIEDARADARFKENPLVTGPPHIRFYAGFPVCVAGHALGTLCLIDRSPRTLSKDQVHLMEALAQQVAQQLEWRRDVSRVAASLPPRHSGTIRVSPRNDSVCFRVELDPTAISEISGPFEEWTGHRPEDFRNRPGALEELIHPQDLRLAVGAPAEAKQEPVPLRWRRADGSYLWLEHELELLREEGRLVAVRGSARPVSHELSEQRDSLVRDQARRMQLDVLSIVDEHGALRFCSPAVLELCGYEPGDLEGKCMMDFVHPEDRGELSSRMGSIASLGGSLRASYRHRCRTGDWRVVESTLQDMLDDPAVRGTLVRTRDMSAWADAAEELRQSQREAQQLAESRRSVIADLERERRQKDQLTAHVVHDLKSPLTAIFCNAHFIARGQGEFAEEAADILAAAESMQRMVDDLLDLSAWQGGVLRVSRRPTHFVELVTDTCRRSKAVAAGREQTLRVSAQVAAEPSVDVDGDLLRRVVQNLLDNSMKYSPRGGEIHVHVQVLDRVVNFAIEDQGSGVPVEARSQIFELYRRLDEHESVRSSHGLGLAFCKMVIDAHGGTIWVEDVAPRGASFRFEVPRVPSSESIVFSQRF